MVEVQIGIGIAHLQVIASTYADSLFKYKNKLIRGHIYKTVNLLYNKLDESKYGRTVSDKRISARREKYKNKIVVDHAIEDINEGVIDYFQQPDGSAFDVERELAAIDAFAAANPGEPVSGEIRQRLLRHLITSPAAAFESTGTISKAEQPSTAPIKWKDREPGETPPDFIRRAYGPWLKDGISKRVLRKIDPPLMQELYAWTRKGNEMPADIKILTLKEENDRILAAGDAGVREHIGKFTGAEALREAARLRGAFERRK